MKRSVVCDCARRIPGSDNAGAAAAARNSERRETSIKDPWDIRSALLSAAGRFVLGELTVRRAVAGRLDAKAALQRLKTPLQLLLDPGVARIRQQMVITVMADLVAGLED